MKVLFLDVDGLADDLAQQGALVGIYTDVARIRLALVRMAVVENLVLSSTWRKHEKMLPYLYSMLGCVVQSRTPMTI
jgi:hypothetical protein